MTEMDYIERQLIKTNLQEKRCVPMNTTIQKQNDMNIALRIRLERVE